jgi:lipocalin
MNNAFSYDYVKDLDLTKYDGFWYEVYQDRFDNVFQKNGSCVTAQYTIIDDNNVSVFNSEILPSGEQSNISGYAFYQGDNYGGELSVYLEGTPKPAPYWVVELGPIYDDDYDYSIVSDDKQISLFVLARDIDRFFKLYNDDVLESLETMGFVKKYNEPIVVDQENCN